MPGYWAHLCYWFSYLLENGAHNMQKHTMKMHINAGKQKYIDVKPDKVSKDQRAITRLINRTLEIRKGTAEDSSKYF